MHKYFHNQLHIFTIEYCIIWQEDFLSWKSGLMYATTPLKALKSILMSKQFSVRYGRNYKVVLAIVLPGLLIAPFILLMQEYKPLEEWKIWLIIFGFLGSVISLSIWLATRVYPPTILSITENKIDLTFEPWRFLSPSDFSFYISDITSFTEKEIGTDTYYLFEVQNPYRKFQISSASYAIEDSLSFNEAMVEISEMVNQLNESKSSP